MSVMKQSLVSVTHTPWISPNVRAILSQVFTLAVLIAAWAYGHATHWTFIPGQHADHADHGGQRHTEAHYAAQGAVADQKHSEHVEFESESAVGRAGIQTVEPSNRMLTDEIVATGVTGYDDRVTARLSARLAGTVWRLEKHLGDPVHKGDTLAIIDCAEVGRLKADFLSSLVTMESSQEQLEKLEQASDSVPERMIREARSAFREARIRLLNAEQALSNLGFSIHADDYLKLSDLERNRRILVANLPATVVETLDLANCSSNLLPVIAPFDGVVISRDVTIGELVTTATPVFEISDVRQMWLILHVSKADAARVARGQMVRFRADGVETEFESQISWISTEVNTTTRTLTVRADIHNRDSKGTADCLKANLFGVGHIVVDRREHAMVVPKECVHRDGDRSFVFEQTSPTTFESRPVTRGLATTGLVEIVDGVRPGSKIAGRGSHVLKAELALVRLEAGEQ